MDRKASIIVGVLVGGAGAALLTLLFSGFSSDMLMAAMLRDPVQWLDEPAAIGGVIGGAVGYALAARSGA